MYQKGHWAYSEAVLELRQKGILIGYPKGSFNGTIPKDVPKPKPSYDLSTPASAWHSLMRAMSTGDETEICKILSEDCFTRDLPIYLGYGLKTADLRERRAAYRALAARISGRKFLIIPSFTAKDGSEVLAELDSGQMEPFIGFGWEVQMNRSDQSWSVSAILHSEE